MGGSVFHQFEDIGPLKRVTAGEHKDRCLERCNFVDQPFGFLGAQLQRAAGRLGAGTAVDTGQVACLSCFPDYNKRSLIKVQFHVGFCVLPGKSVVTDLSVVALRFAACYTGADRGGCIKVANKFTANSVTAVISVSADTGSHDHAQWANPW